MTGTTLARRVRYAELASFFERLEGQPGRLGMTSLLVELLDRVQPKDMVCVVRLMQGQVAPDWEGLEVGLAEKQILKALAIATGASTKSEEALARIQAVYQETGDLGLAAERLLASGGARRQATLLGGGPLTVANVFRTIHDIAKVQGTGSQDTKQRMLAQLLVESTPIEARYITRMVAGRLRLGLADMTFLDALAAWHLQKGVKSVTERDEAERAELVDARRRLERAFDVRSDMAVIAETLATGGMEAIDALDVEPGTPLRPMAAERLKTIPEILERMGNRSLMEYKYDGLRVQAHIPKRGDVRLFSRRLEETTHQFPDVAKALRQAFGDADCIVEGEAVSLDEEGKMRPFQDISRRRGRKLDLEAATEEVPVTVFLFDCLAEKGRSVMDEPLEQRRQRLQRMLSEGGKGAGRTAAIRMSTAREATTPEEVEAFFTEAVEDGAEGIMCKDPRSAYKAGSRGYAWIKFKAEYQEGMADSMDLVAIGAFYGRGRRAGWYGALLCAAWDPANQRFASVCKLGTGFSDAMLESLKGRFAPHVLPAKPDDVDAGLQADVWFDPKVVLEVQCAELTLSPTHRAGWGLVKEGAGFAARFPRFIQWRDDKGPHDATTVEELVSMHAARRR